MKTPQPTTAATSAAAEPTQAELEAYQKALYDKLDSSTPLLWGMAYCGRHFSMNSPQFHMEILDACTDYRYLAVAAPRESSKSTLLAFLIPAFYVAHRKKRFIVLVQNTYAKACGSLSTIKQEFRTNQALAKYNITFRKDSEGDTIFHHPDGFEVRVLCKGHEQIGSVRGEKFGPYRPDLILCDDLEDDVMVRSRERRENLKYEFDEALIPAGDKKLCKYIIIGTILHDDSLMAKLISREMYKEYRKLKYQALCKVDGKEESLWPEKWSIDDLKRMEAEKPSVFAKEYQNDPSYGILGVFHREDFRYWNVERGEYVLFNTDGRIKATGRLSDCKAAIACDLAWEEKRESDYSVIMPGFLTPQSDLLVGDYTCKKGMRPHEMEEILFSMEVRLKAITGSSVSIGLEKAKLEKVMRWWLQQAMRRRNYYLILKDLVWDTDKIQRIETRLESRYNQHSVYHKRGMGELELQLLRVRSGVHDDLPDALQGLVQLLQYPKYLPKEGKASNDPFEWWRDLAIKSKKPQGERFVFGKKGKHHEIPAKISFR